MAAGTVPCGQCSPNLTLADRLRVEVLQEGHQPAMVGPLHPSDQKCRRRWLEKGLFTIDASTGKSPPGGPMPPGAFPELPADMRLHFQCGCSSEKQTKGDFF